MSWRCEGRYGTEACGSSCARRGGARWSAPACSRAMCGGPVAKADGYILREQKHRRGKSHRTPAPMLPEVLDVLRQLVDTLPDLADSEPIFRATSGRHHDKPLGSQGIYHVVRRLFAAVGAWDEQPGAIPYDLRDSFATHVGRAVRASGGRISEAQDVARRLLGHGDGDDVLARYWDDDERHLELAAYSPLRLVSAESGGSDAESGGASVESGGPGMERGGPVVEIGGLEPPTSAMRTRRSPS